MPDSTLISPTHGARALAVGTRETAVACSKKNSVAQWESERPVHRNTGCMDTLQARTDNGSG
jgi:hypothetical protein